VVAGPTASGKSALALAVAEALDGVVINADSMQVYRELRILTARPAPDEEKRVPHRLYGVLSAAERCSAGRWRAMAIAEIEAAHAEGRLPVVCGGTGLYLKALADGLSAMPDVPPAIHTRLAGRVRAEGPGALHAELLARDPGTAARLEPTDSQRIVRALEVLEATGRPLTDWQAGPLATAPQGLRFATVLLMPPRTMLYAACDRRVNAMVEEGVLDEVRRMTALGLDPSLPAMKAVGFREFAAFLEGNCDLATAVAAAQQATRRYAKRQMTWFRHQIIADLTLDAQFSESLLPEIFAFIRPKLLTGAG